MTNQELAAIFIGCFGAASKPTPVPDYITEDSLLEDAIQEGILEDDFPDDEDESE